MWPNASVLRIQVLTESLVAGTGLQGAGDFLARVVRIVRESPLETVGLLAALVLAFVVVARFNSL